MYSRLYYSKRLIESIKLRRKTGKLLDIIEMAFH
jgi:hypothetical protein